METFNLTITKYMKFFFLCYFVLCFFFYSEIDVMICQQNIHGLHQIH